MKKYISKIRRNDGVAAIIMVLIVATAVLAIISTLTAVALSSHKMVQSPGAFDQTYYAAEAGINEGLFRLINNPIPGNYSFQFEGMNIDVSVVNDTIDPFKRIIESRVADPSGRIRTLRISAETNSYSGGFDSSVISGFGGLEMENGSCVIGNVFSNGPVTGPGSNNNGCKTAAATACRPAYPNKDSIIQKDASHDGKVTLTGVNSIADVKNSGDMVAHNIKNSISGKQAKYQTLTGSVKADGGTETCGAGSGTFCHPGNPDEAAKDLPINAAVINGWKADITVAAPAAYDDCPSDATKYCISSHNRTLGLNKILGDLYVSNGETLTLTDNLWVTGNIILDNNGTIRLDPSLGGLSAVIIADGIVDVGNNYSLIGSGNTSSFLLIVSIVGMRSGNCSDHDLAKRPAICASNNSDSIIFAAPNGALRVKNGGCLNAAATNLVHLEPNSTVNFNPAMASFTVPGGGGTEVDAVGSSWEEL